MLLISEDEVHQLLRMGDCIDVLDQLFKDFGDGGASNMSRYRVPLPKGAQQIMGGMSSAFGATGLKTYVTGVGPGSQMAVLLFSLESAQPLALIAASGLGQIRTGAASGLATRYMARPDARTVAIIGTGSQARTQLSAVCAARTIEQAWVYSRTQERREAFARDMAGELGVSVSAAATAEEAVSDADVVCTITNSREPVLTGSMLHAGMHVNAAGSNHWMRRELDDDAVRRCDLVVADDVAQAKIECGELIWAAERRAFRWERAVELRDVASGRVVGRPSADAITLFESQGLGIEDVAAGMFVYRKAVEAGAGREVAF